MKNNLEEVFTPKTTEEIIKDQLELKEKAYQNYLLVHDYNGSISIREDFMAGFDEGAGSRGFFGRYSASLNNRNKQLEQELQKKSNMLAKVKRYFGISVRKNSEMRQELQKTKEILKKNPSDFMLKCGECGNVVVWYEQYTYQAVIVEKDKEIKTLKEQLSEAIKLAKLGIYSVDGLLTHNHESWELSAESWLFKTKIFLEKQDKENKENKE